MALVERCLALVASFPQQTVLGVGDLILDQYRRGKAIGLSPEAPAIELLNPGLVETPGGAANVAWNIGHLGGTVHMVGVVGRDGEGKALRALLERTPGVSFRAVEDPSRSTTLKLRFYHDQYQILRVNQETRDGISAEVAAACRAAITENLSGCGAVFVEDYGKGLLREELVATLMDLRRQTPLLPVMLDPKVGNHDVYQKGMCTHIKPNWSEACALLGEDPDRADRNVIARRLSEAYDADVFITLGGEGMLVYERKGSRVTRVPARRREEFDVTGAGDTTLAVLALALAAGASGVEAAALANLAGGIVVEKSSTAYVTPEELTADLRHPETRTILAGVEERVRQQA